jgi:coenzyme F420-0:L-glutamate ligase / coenzyme F420-1:gamma-L-glutamate ligase
LQLSSQPLQIIPIPLKKDVTKSDDIGRLIMDAISETEVSIREHDVLVVTQKIVSKSEDRVLDLSTVEPSDHALELASKTNKDPRFVELVLAESRDLLRYSENLIITETRHGFVCANSGVDQSNVSIHEEKFVSLLPLDPDLSAKRIRQTIYENSGVNIAVVVSDTFGRPFRLGQTNVAIGVSGINSIKSYVGLADMYGNMLRITEIAVADELASAAELVVGKTERVPIAVVRGYEYSPTETGTAKSLIRERAYDLFR